MMIEDFLGGRRALRGRRIPRITATSWGRQDGREVLLFRLLNDKGSYVELTNFGATLVSAVVPDKDGRHDNVLLGFPSLQGYVQDNCYIGRTIGRFANRIAKARFTLNGICYSLDANDQGNSNHGGFAGFHGRSFSFDILQGRITFTLDSKSGEGGFPGNVTLKVIYSWTDDDELSIVYEAVTDAPTILNITNHAYFNLSALKDNVFGHYLTITSRSTVETSSQWIPTGKIVSDHGDLFVKRTGLIERITVDGSQIRGINTYYIFDPNEMAAESPQAVLYHPASGRILEVFTSYPGLQLYTGDYLSSVAETHHARTYKPFDGLCLECHHYPDSQNQPQFPSAVLNPSDIYREKIVYKFGVRSDLNDR